MVAWCQCWSLRYEKGAIVDIFGNSIRVYKSEEGKLSLMNPSVTEIRVGIPGLMYRLCIQFPPSKLMPNVPANYRPVYQTCSVRCIPFFAPAPAPVSNIKLSTKPPVHLRIRSHRMCAPSQNSCSRSYCWTPRMRLPACHDLDLLDADLTEVGLANSDLA